MQSNPITWLHSQILLVTVNRTFLKVAICPLPKGGCLIGSNCLCLVFTLHIFMEVQKREDHNLVARFSLLQDE